ncbi:hypothetical protein FOYG_16115 [Fusarium oxysporum NRRL 32931]|uniref:Uncharacterized protein n=1 Tax=Fusarium oxysporum NRRL 32931 TaxID=660029 RepID=W9HM16_FUSOX|nr:hypothetical protein FOYG_16115 [Fusarium oxysporum NRRL 32931]
MTPSITDDDDDDHETHFSDSSGRPIKPYRLRQKEPAYLGIASDSSVSNSSPAGAGLDSRLSLRHQHLTIGIGENKEDLKPRHFLAELKRDRQGLIDQLNSTTEKLRRKVAKLEGRA